MDITKKTLIIILVGSFSFSMVAVFATTSSQNPCPNGTTFLSAIVAMPHMGGKPLFIVTCKLPQVVPSCLGTYQSSVEFGTNILVCKK